MSSARARAREHVFFRNRCRSRTPPHPAVAERCITSRSSPENGRAPAVFRNDKRKRDTRARPPLGSLARGVVTVCQAVHSAVPKQQDPRGLFSVQRACRPVWRGTVQCATRPRLAVATPPPTKPPTCPTCPTRVTAYGNAGAMIKAPTVLRRLRRSRVLLTRRRLAVAVCVIR